MVDVVDNKSKSCGQHIPGAITPASVIMISLIPILHGDHHRLPDNDHADLDCTHISR